MKVVPAVLFKLYQAIDVAFVVELVGEDRTEELELFDRKLFAKFRDLLIVALDVEHISIIAQRSDQHHGKNVQ